MKKNQFLGAALALIVLGHSCKNDDYRDLGTKENSQVQFTSAIAGSVGTRVTGNAWDGNDAIGVFMKQGNGLANPLAANKKYTTGGNGNFSAQGTEIINYPETGSVDFIAYYPYSANLSGTTLPVTVANQATPAAIDVLYSNNATGLTKSSGTANLNFSHKLAKVELTVKPGTGVTDVNGLQVAYNNVNTTASLDLATGTLSGAAAAQNVSAKTTAQTGAQLVEAILLPGDFSSKEVVFTLASGTFKWTMPASTTFEGGKKYTYDIVLQTTTTGNQVAVTGAGTITDWTTVPGGSINVGVDGTTPTNPGTGTEQTLFLETFGATKVTSNTKIASFTDWDNKTLVFSDAFATADIRGTGATGSNNVWFPAASATVTGASLKIEGVNTTGFTKLKLSFNLVANNPINLNVMTVKYNGVTYAVPSQDVTDRNVVYPVTLDLSTATPSATGTLEFSTGSTNTAGLRLDDVKLVGTK